MQLVKNNIRKSADRTKAEYFADVFNLLLKKQIPLELLNNYFNDSEEYDALATFVVNNMKPEVDWSTGIGMIEAVEHMYQEAVGNTNLTEL